ncbi:MAG TPA: hypothetical protein VLA24_09310 [Pseudomonadales bacterium]|nr:hypothetical protein [Pseudomonadales bacterium]
MTDRRPAPNPRKNSQLWQAYLFWEELMLMRQRHNLRIDSIEKGKSNLDAIYERSMLEGSVIVGKKTYQTFHLDETLEVARKIMIYQGTTVPVWDWITSIKGLGAGSQAAKVLALIDDIEKFDSVAKLWRYAGYGLYKYYEDDGKVIAPIRGKVKQGTGEDSVINEIETEQKEGWKLVTVRDRGINGYVLPYNKKLKSTLYIMATLGFINQQTPYYSDIYYSEKIRQRELHPEKIVENGVTKFNDGHIHNRAIRKMIKEFLKNLWIEWRTLEGLPTGEEYNHD